MPRLVIQSGAHKGEEIELQRGSNFLGRAEGCDFTLDDPTVSSRHCEVVVTELGVQIRDLDSTNGTFIDTQRVKSAELRNGQILMLGSMEMRLMGMTVDVVIPKVTAAAEPVAIVLPDGTAACLHHPGIPASHKCRQCGKAYCEACVRELHLVGGKSRMFCPACSGACEPLGPKTAPRKRSFASRFLETIRIPFRRPDRKE